jgi:hypothetical protein
VRRTRLALVLACVLGGLAWAEEPPTPPPPAGAPSCVLPAFLETDDAGLWATYDGIRRGLEEASLPRVCRQEWPKDDAGWTVALAAGRAAGAPLVFAVGREAIERCAARVEAWPAAERPLCVYVDTALVGESKAYPPDPEVPLPAAIVRAEVPLRRWRDLVHGLLGPGRPSVAVLSEKEAERAAAEAALGSLDADLVSLDRARVVLDLPPFGRAPAGATLPILSTDRSRFGRDACAVVVPEHGRLGRLAAECARRLQAGEGRDRALRAALRGAEIWVDLDACDRAGLSPPLAFLASVDRLRRGAAGAEERR